MTFLASVPFILAESGSSSADPLTILLTWGPGGLLVVLILSGILEPKRVRETLETERNDWKMAFEKEQQAHQRTREALAAAEQRAEIAVDAAKQTNMLLDEMQRPHERPVRKRTPDGGPRT